MSARFVLPVRPAVALCALFLAELTVSTYALAQQRPVVSPPVVGRYLAVLREGAPAAEAASRMRSAGAAEVTAHTHLGTVAVAGSAAAVRRIAADPAVAEVIPDHMVYAHRLLRPAVVDGAGRGKSGIVVRRGAPLRVKHVDAGSSQPVAGTGTASGGSGAPNSAPGAGASSGAGPGTSGTGGASSPGSNSGTTTAPSSSGTSTAAGSSSAAGTSSSAALTDSFYQGSPQGWAVRAAGGFGKGVLGGNNVGPWNRTLGAGVRIAVLDSGVDETHPDIAPNLALSMSEVDTAAQASPCDDGSPQDQQGHGTWVASLAAGAMGAGTGRVAGVAPKAALLNIKVLQRMPGDGATVAAQCKAGQAAGLVSWLLKGIDDAVAQHADVIVLSLGSIVDLYTGDGAGLKVAFDRVTHAAANAGVLIVAAAGNDGFDLGNARYVELPAQARDVLPITATTNADCAENNATGAACAAGPVALPYYTNYGTPLQAVAAPGGNYPVGADEAVSGWVRGACSNGKANTADGMPLDSTHSFGCFDLGHTAYVQAMGTSASAGLAAGAAALLRAAHPGWTPAQVALAMRSATVKLRDGSTVLDTAAAMDFTQP